MTTYFMKKLFLIILIGIIAATQLAMAADFGRFVTCDGPECTVCDLIKLVHNVINWLIQISFVLAVAMVVYGGYVIMFTGATSPSAVSKGKTIIGGAIAGVAIVLLAWVIVNTVLQSILGVKTPWPWNSIPNDCKPTSSATQPIPGGSASNNTTKTTFHLEQLPMPPKKPNPAGALEPQGPVGPNGQVPTAPTPETFGPPSPFLQPSPNTTPFPAPASNDFGA